MFSKTYGYALCAAVFVAAHGQNGKKISLRELSQELGIPHHFLGKIMQDLVRHGILGSAKGPNGGFYAAENTLKVRLIDILIVTDGNLIFNQCALNIRGCNSERPCPLHHDFAVCREGMLKEMSIKTLGALVESVEEKRIFLSR